MNIGRIAILGIILWVFLLLEKYLFFESLGFSAAWQAWVYYILIIILVRIISRRMGVINFLEAIFIALIWLLMVLLLDSFISKRFLSEQIFRTNHYWWAYFTVFWSVFFLHKKRHIHIRKEQAAQHHH